MMLTKRITGESFQMKVCPNCGQPKPGDICEGCKRQANSASVIPESDAGFKTRNRGVRLASWIVVALVLLALGAVGDFKWQNFRQDKLRAKAASKAQAATAASYVREANEREVVAHEEKVRSEIARLISQSEKFAVCKVKIIPFNPVDTNASIYRPAPQKLDSTSPVGCKPVGEIINFTLPQDADYLGMLLKTGYACEARPSDSHFLSPYPFWRATRKVQDNPDKIIVGNNPNKIIAANSTTPGYRKQATAILGCRDLVRIDEIRPLAKGSLTEFSWRWNVNEFGNVEITLVLVDLIIIAPILNLALPP